MDARQDDQDSIESIFGSLQVKFIADSLMKSRKVSPQDEVSYDPVDMMSLSRDNYTITAHHVPIEEIIKHGSGSCKKCNSKGYQVSYIVKNRVPNPQDYVILSEKPLTEMTPEEKKLWMEVEKKKTTWKIMLPCRCAMKAFMKDERNIMCNDAGNIVARLTYVMKEQK
jgi:hypothetical protein